MNRTLVVPFLLVTLWAAAATRTPIYVLEPGVYERIVIDDGELWLGVYPSGDHAVVRDCTLSVSRFTSEQYEGEGNKVEATRVEASPATPLFLLKGSKNVKPGNVKTLYLKDDEYPSNIPITLAGKQYALETVDETLSDGFRIKKLVLKLDGRTMALGDCPRRDAIAPVWAGDLDGDGRLDVFVRIEHHNYGVEQLLFLSSADATGKAITARAARISIRKFE